MEISTVIKMTIFLAETNNSTEIKMPLDKVGGKNTIYINRHEMNIDTLYVSTSYV